MTPEEIKNTDFETFFQAVPQMKEVHHIKATGQEIYHVYKQFGNNLEDGKKPVSSSQVLDKKFLVFLQNIVLF